MSSQAKREQQKSPHQSRKSKRKPFRASLRTSTYAHDALLLPGHDARLDAPRRSCS